MNTSIHREITPLSLQDSFLVFDRVKNEFEFPVHFHPEYEINFILNGRGVRRIVGDHIGEIEDYELVIVGPNLQHGWEQFNCSNEDIHEITIQFHNDLFAKNLLDRHIMKPIKDMFQRAARGILFSHETSEMIAPRILEVSKIDGIDYFLELTSILYDLAISRNQKLLSTLTSELEDFENSDKIKKVYDFIQENYERRVTLSEMAELVNMSEISFNRFLKKRTGKTFIEFINDTRVGYAARWLIEKDLSIAEIAYKSGFNNIANFNRVFKKVKNATPSQYRKEFSGIKRIL